MPEGYRQAILIVVLQLFCKEVTLVPGWEIFQFAKNLVAMLFVEIWRLKAERVQVNILCPLFPGFLFSHCQQAMPVPAAAQVIFYPQQMDKAPTPIDFAN